MSGVRASTRGSSNSDKPEKPLRFDSTSSCLFVRRRLENIQPPKPFQAGARATQPVGRACVSLGAHCCLPRTARGSAALARTRRLNRRTRHRAVGTEYATVARLWLQLRAAAGAFIELAGIRRHGFRFRDVAVRTGDGRLKETSDQVFGSALGTDG